MAMRTATARLRRTFAYPGDETTSFSASASDLEPAELDETEQDSLIQALQTQNRARDAQFRLLLLALPALSTVPYLLALFRAAARFPGPRLPDAHGGGGGGNGRADVWLATLALTSLAATAWALWALPPGRTGVRALDAWVAGSESSPSTMDNSNNHNAVSLGGMGGARRRRRRSSVGVLGGPGAEALARNAGASPLETYLPLLNAGLCVVLVVMGWIAGSGNSGSGGGNKSSPTAATEHWGHVGLANLPAVVYGVVLVAKMVMGSVDPERDLSALRYEYKGA
ncbi:hypothetical protein F4780DRAFT_219783 [Xylariomycetidae sp. FL0641]|nr:hypothetical protein F4780DRAFT_219783 [Xylariomycetidae sp. FL0641]